MNETCFYIVSDSRFSHSYTPLKLTGRWKLTFSPYSIQPTLYLEHQGRFFKKWVSEINILSGYKQEEYINKCVSKFYRFGQYHQHMRFSYNNTHE